jgi:hypothetical protein
MDLVQGSDCAIYGPPVTLNFHRNIVRFCSFLALNAPFNGLFPPSCKVEMIVNWTQKEMRHLINLPAACYFKLEVKVDNRGQALI